MESPKLLTPDEIDKLLEKIKFIMPGLGMIVEMDNPLVAMVVCMVFKVGFLEGSKFTKEEMDKVIANN